MRGGVFCRILSRTVGHHDREERSAASVGGFGQDPALFNPVRALFAIARAKLRPGWSEVRPDFRSYSPPLAHPGSKRRRAQTCANGSRIGLASLRCTRTRWVEVYTRAANLKSFNRMVPAVAWAKAVPFSANARSLSTRV